VAIALGERVRVAGLDSTGKIAPAAAL